MNCKKHMIPFNRRIRVWMPESERIAQFIDSSTVDVTKKKTRLIEFPTLILFFISSQFYVLYKNY